MTPSDLSQRALMAYQQFLARESESCLSGDSHFLALPFVVASGHTATLALRPLIGGHVEVSDQGGSIADLFLATSNLPHDVPARVREIADEFGVKVDKDDVLILRVKEHEVGEAVHRMLQARLRIGDLLLLQRVSVPREEHLAKRLRTEILEPKLGKKTIRRYAHATIEGEREVHRVDYFFNSSANVAIKTLDRREELQLQVEAWAWKWQDIAKRNRRLNRITIYDQRNRFWSTELLDVAGANSDPIPVQDRNRLLSLAEVLRISVPATL